MSWLDDLFDEPSEAPKPKSHHELKLAGEARTYYLVVYSWGGVKAFVDKRDAVERMESCSELITVKEVLNA